MNNDQKKSYLSYGTSTSYKFYRFIPILFIRTCVYETIRRPWFIYDLRQREKMKTNWERERERDCGGVEVENVCIHVRITNRWCIAWNVNIPSSEIWMEHS